MSQLSGGVETDAEVLAGLNWLASASRDATGFWQRIEAAQRRYRQFTLAPDNLGRDPELADLGPDLVASFLAQAKSLLDSRRTYDIALASRCVPWVKQIGVNASELTRIPGASERARRMLVDRATAPDGPLLELVMGGNYANDGLDVAFVAEEPGHAKTPDLHLFLPGSAEPVAIELKRLRQGRYEQDERARHRRIFKQAAAIIDERHLSLHIDVIYTKELMDVPESYLAERLSRFLASPLVILGAYPWRDEFASGEIRSANLDAVREDMRNTSLYFGTKMARLLTGSEVRSNGYHLATSGIPDNRDPRFMDEVHYASVVTWQCTAAEALDRKARHVKNKLVEAERQVQSAGIGIIHLAMDAEVGCESSDLRRERNKQAILQFQSESLLAALYIHYLVPRMPEAHSWLVDETVDKFGAGRDPVPSMMIFPGSAALDNDLPAWKQAVPFPPSGGSPDRQQR
ncbi:hypothetical protein [Cupriavidus sp. BIC8F]|uniref:hypothetical protein n=1 Tax=Cupriavidus sp. BIC8F TaxID=3079014 RepID=UPI002915C830|nr:hypothetical protein [Cupriavidus sp. BIC8F]